jgi:two-component system phosphate regulon sensor histidine kinase PhoR
MMENHGTRDEVVQAEREGVGRSLRYSTTVKEDMLYVAMPIEEGNELIGVLRVSLFLKDINGLLDGLKVRIAWITLVIVALSLVVAFFFSRGLSHPVSKLRSAARRLSEGDFDARVFLKGGGELRELAEGFNRMAEMIRRLFTDLSRRKEELDSIVASIPEGLAVLDQGGSIRLANPAFRRMVNGEEVEGRPWWEVFRGPGFGGLLRRVEGEGAVVEEMEYTGRVFQCNATRIRPGGNVVVLWHDITEARRLEAVKRDFVLNVSHELRTPLTAIKGFAETLLEEEDNEKRRHYLEIMDRHTDRLVHIVEDLLTLSALEDGGSRLELERVDLEEVTGRLLPLFGKRAREKGLLLRREVVGRVPAITADPLGIEQVLMNLLDNALKYTEHGEITVVLGPHDDGVLVQVRDTGVGIPADQKDRIFERFYVVDKSRSREMGGTGLGLSIVRHIVLLHNGRISVDSRPGEGSTFTVILPAEPA